MSEPELSESERSEVDVRPFAIDFTLGGYEEVVNEAGQVESIYRLGDECLKCLKDLKRFWRMDDVDDDRNVARILAETNVLANDLIPIMKTCIGTGPRGDKIALACADLITAMTWPIDVIEELKEAHLVDQNLSKVDYSGLLAAQLSYKAVLLRTGTLACLFRLILPSLEKERRQRSERDENIISLVLHSIRNLASIKDKPRSTYQSGDSLELSNLQSDLIVQMEKHQIFEFLLTVASLSEKSEFSPWNMVTLDILHLLFRGVSPEDLIKEAEEVRQSRLGDLLENEKKTKLKEQRKGTTRHSRFSTTLTLEHGNRRYNLHRQSAISLSPTKVLDMVKRSKKKGVLQDDDLAPPTELTPDGLKALRTFAYSFLEDGCNRALRSQSHLVAPHDHLPRAKAFFSSVIKDITMERAKVREADTIRMLVLSKFFLQFFLLVQKRDRERAVCPLDDAGHDFDLIAELTEPATIGYVTKRLKDALEEKPPLWSELHASVECFAQLLLVIESLSTSETSDYRDVADILQNKLYYQQDLLDTILNVLSRYKDQSKKYLDSIVNLTYVLMRMLERYSKSKDFMYVRMKKAKKAKKNVGADDEVNAEEEEDVADQFTEKSFDFSSFENRLVNESVLTTLLTYLEGYQTFKDEDQMKRVVALLYRQAVKCRAEGLFYKVSVLELFRRILDDRKNLPRQAAYTDLVKLIEFILKQFFKHAQTQPLALVQTFYPKRRGDLSKLSKSWKGGEDEDEQSDEDSPKPKALRMPAEVEIRGSDLTETQRIGVAVSRLVQEDKEHLVDWVKDTLKTACAERDEIVLSTDGMPEELADDDDDDREALMKRKLGEGGKPSEEAVTKFTPHEAKYDDDDQKKSATRDSDLKLLLRELAWQSSTDEVHLTLLWTIPADRLPSTLRRDIALIDGFLISPIDSVTGKKLSDLVKKVRKPRKRRAASDEEEGDEPARKKARKRKEEIKAYKSAQFVEDDTDEEEDKEFFAKEAALRVKIALAAAAGATLGDGKGKKQKAKKRPRKSVGDAVTTPPRSDAEVISEDEEREDSTLISPPRNGRRDVDMTEEGERPPNETPASPDIDLPPSSGRYAGRQASLSPVVKKVRRIVDSDDE